MDTVPAAPPPAPGPAAPPPVEPPLADPDTLVWWDGLRAHEIHVPRCDECGEHRFPPTPWCPTCGIPGSTWVTLDGRGRVYSWVVVRRAFEPAFADDVPYTVAVVELAPGCRVLARLESTAEHRAPEDPDPTDWADREVEPVFVDHEAWTELRFRAPTSPAPVTGGAA